jgi:hypothetical protein
MPDEPPAGTMAAPASLAIFADGPVAEGQSGTTLASFTVRRAAQGNNGSSFLLGDGSVRVVADGLSNTLLFGEGNAVFTEDEAGGVSAGFSDGSVRFVRDAIDGWQYQRRNGAGTVLAEGSVADDARFTFGDGSVRFLADGLSNTVLFGEDAATLRGGDAAGWRVEFGDGSVRNLGSTARYLPGDGSVRFIDRGASFRLGDGSVRVVSDGLSNTVLFGEGEAVFSEDETGGVSAGFSDGSVRFVRDAIDGWQYQRRDGGGTVVAEGAASNGTTFTFGDGSVRFLADGLSNTILFGEEVALEQAPGGSWSAVLGDGSVRQLGDGLTLLFEEGVFPFAAGAASVAWSVAGSGAAPADAADFAGGVLPSGTLSFAPGQTSAILTVALAGDLTPEADEGFTVTLSGASAGAAITGAVAAATILNDDGPPAVLSIARQQAARAEGQSGGTAFTFLATRSGDTTRPASAAWAVTGGGVANTVLANGADFAGGVLPYGSVSFAAGQTSRTITVTVAGDTTVELNESFRVTLHTPAPGAVLGTAAATAVIYNDDTRGTGTLSIARAQAQQAEGNGGGSTPFTFTVTRGDNTSGGAAVDWAVAGGGVANTVPAGAADFAGGVLPSGRLHFAPGQGTATITVNVAADAAIELNEGFTVTLSAPQAGVSLGTAAATGAILNDDFQPSGELSIARLAASRGEGDGGGTGFTFLVTRALGTQGPASAAWAVTGGGVDGTQAADGADFAGGALPSGTVSFAPGQASQVVTVTVAGDLAVEQDESFTVTLSGAPSGVTLGTAAATGLISNDDPGGTGTLSIARAMAQAAEGHEGETGLTFAVTRSGDLSGAAGVDWAVSGGTVAGTVAANAADFAGGRLPSGRLVFAPGQASQLLTVAVAGDAAAELNESFTVTLSNTQAGVALGAASATGVILNDDFASTAASQTLSGTAAADLFLLGGGLDAVFGRGGADLFRVLPAAIGPASDNAATLEDFSRAAGEAIDLSAIDAIAATLADDAFAFIGAAAFGGIAGQLRWQDEGALRRIQGDVNGDAVADITLLVRNAVPPDASWFVL